MTKDLNAYHMIKVLNKILILEKITFNKGFKYET